MKKQFVLIIFFLTTTIFAQENWNQLIDSKLNSVISSHRTFVSIPNLPSDIKKMYENVSWVKQHYGKVGFKLKTLESSTLPVLFAERIINPSFKTLRLLSCNVFPVDVISVIISDDPIKG